MMRFRHSTQIVPVIPPRSVSMCEPRDLALGSEIVGPGTQVSGNDYTGVCV